PSAESTWCHPSTRETKRSLCSPSGRLSRWAGSPTRSSRLSEKSHPRDRRGLAKVKPVPSLYQDKKASHLSGWLVELKRTVKCFTPARNSSNRRLRLPVPDRTRGRQPPVGEIAAPP